MSDDPAAVVSEYFARMKAGDSSVVELFHDDAELIGLGGTRKGKQAIEEFYRGVIERAGPKPRLVGSLLPDGSRVAAEIFIELGDGQRIHAVDLFVVEARRIRSLTYFLCAHTG
jgi:hypothetical protein